jgi:hypothetical protein
MIGLVLLTPYFILHASHIYMTVLTLSGGHDDRVRWPRETLLEWFGEGSTAFGVLLVWSTLTLVPVGSLFHDGPPKSALLTWLAVMGLVVPISLCSVMTAPSRLLLLYPPLIVKLLRHGKELLFVYFITIQLFLVVWIGLWLMFSQRNPFGILVVSVALPPALMLHARAWGRLAWLAMNCDLPPPKRRRKRKSAREEMPLEVDLEVIDDGGDDYVMQPYLPAVCERLVTMTEIQDEKLEFQRQRHARRGEPDPLDGPRRPTFDMALGQHAFFFLFEGDTLGEWFSFGLTCFITMALLQLVASVFL